ncbi:MAG: sigma-54-dependent transcriptional regulator [Chloroflexota bacterium]|nr:sigma-54 dependent transcriptional regulator [Lentimicrobium sp.]
MSKVLIVDDDITFCLMLETFLTRQGYVVEQSLSFHDAVNKISKFRPAIVLTDLRLPDNDGLNLLKEVALHSPGTPVVLMTGYGDIRTAVQAMRMGAFDYITKPVNPDEMLITMRRALTASAKATENLPDTEINPEKAVAYVEGISNSAKKISDYITLVAPTNMSVLILGESGTGKEVIARKIHMLSKRADKPFVAIDCGALPHELAGSELFGHKKGSFTGAISEKLGQFVVAHGGTIFLDEIGNLNYDIQVQLLRAIQERKVKQVGGTKEIDIDVRILTATNEDLKAVVSKGDFREDLYHRINEFTITVPPLRNRSEDLMLFAEHFLRQANIELGRDVKKFDSEVSKIFFTYSWPGNIREFKNIIKRAVLLSTDNVIHKDSLPEELIEEANKASDIPEAREVMYKSERDLIVSTLERVRFNKSLAAKILKLDRKTLYSKMKLYNIPL